MKDALKAGGRVVVQSAFGPREVYLVEVHTNSNGVTTATLSDQSMEDALS